MAPKGLHSLSFFGHPVLEVSHRSRPSGVDGVERLANQKCLNILLSKLILETLRGAFVPFQGKAVVGGRFGRPILAGRWFDSQRYRNGPVSGGSVLVLRTEKF